MDLPGTTPSRGPERRRREVSPAPLPQRGPTAGPMGLGLGRRPGALRSRPVDSGAKAPAVGKGTTACREPTGAPGASGLDGARRTTRGLKAHGQVPSDNGRWVPQTRIARTTRNEPWHANMCKATPAAVRIDVCAPSREPSLCRLRNSRRPDGPVCALRVHSPSRLQKAALWMEVCAPGGYTAPAGYEKPPSG